MKVGHEEIVLWSHENHNFWILHSKMFLVDCIRALFFPDPTESFYLSDMTAELCVPAENVTGGEVVALQRFRRSPLASPGNNCQTSTALSRDKCDATSTVTTLACKAFLLLCSRLSVSALHAWPGPEGFVRVNFAPDLRRRGEEEGTWTRARGTLARTGAETNTSWLDPRRDWEAGHQSVQVSECTT